MNTFDKHCIVYMVLCCTVCLLHAYACKANWQGHPDVNTDLTFEKLETDNSLEMPGVGGLIK